MKTYVASRMSDGNKVFPCKISIGGNGVTLKIPGFLRGQEATIPFSRISAVDIDCPLIGYSSITISTTGEGNVIGHGFSKSEVKEMKEMILEQI